MDRFLAEHSRIDIFAAPPYYYLLISRLSNLKSEKSRSSQKHAYHFLYFKSTKLVEG